MSRVYPLVTWRVPVPSFTITVGIGFGTPQVLTVPAGSYWGWRTTGAPSLVQRFVQGAAAVDTAPARVATADSLMGVMAATLLTHTDITTAQGLHFEDGTTAVTETNALTGTVGIVTTSNPAALALFGMVAPVTITALDLTLSSIVMFARLTRTAGVWRPAPVADPVTIEPRVRITGQGAWSPYNPAQHERVFVARQRLWETRWEYCAAADVSRAYARQNNYLSVAGRAAGDTAGTLDDLLDAAGQRYDMALALQRADAPAEPITYIPVLLPVTGDIDADGYITDAGAGQRLYTVTLPLLEAQSAVF